MLLNPVIGLDVAKGQSEGQAFLDRGMPHGKHFNVVHTMDGFKRIHQILKEVEKISDTKPVVIFESTGHYHVLIVRFLEEQGYMYIVVNPLIAHQAKKSSLRKMKTDAIDAYRLCELFYKEEFEPLRKRGMQLLDLRGLTRQRDAINSLFIQTKLQFHTVLDLVFPEYRGVFGDLFSKVSLKTLLSFPTPEAALEVSEAQLAETVQSFVRAAQRAGQ